MKSKVSIVLTWPVRWKRIGNGERVIEPNGLDEVEVDVRNGAIRGGSWVEALIRLFAEDELKMRKSRRGSADPRTKVQIPATSNHETEKPPPMEHR